MAKRESNCDNNIEGATVGCKAWSQVVSFLTYEVGSPDPNPMFLDTRVYQGSSGRVYPMPIIDRVDKKCSEKEYCGLHLENDYLYLMMLPEIGGRIHIGFDKISSYDFFYRQSEIKPALVGLAGPWISGGVEFNWPQHHRPSTFMPCSWAIQADADGSKTIWMGDHDPLTRMKGMHGVCVRPGSSLIELKARLYNRTPIQRTFLWWANVAAKVHENYQSFFPPDVQYVADHAKRAVATFPSCGGFYYGVNYGDRAQDGVPAEELPTLFSLPKGVCPSRLDWYSNIPVPTSYMVTATAHEFFGGYDHTADAGFIHVADRHISPGKKQWTWGNHVFGYAWDRNLTDSGGPYVELMAGVYTDNQPDFSFLAPYETKSFSQFWYPIRNIGIPVAASIHAALSIRGSRVGICPSSVFRGAQIEVELPDAIHCESVDIAPEAPFRKSFNSEPVAVTVRSASGELLVKFDYRSQVTQPVPSAATEPLPPGEVKDVSELYQIGVHLDQYRHATREPEPYWEEALHRDPSHVPCRIALSKRLIHRGLFSRAQSMLEEAVQIQVKRNPNPIDGEALYLLGLCLEYQGDCHGALDAYGKAAWNYGVKAAAQVGMARIYGQMGEWGRAEAKLKEAQVGLGDANIIHTMQSALARRGGRFEEAKEISQSVLQRDPLDLGALFETSSPKLAARLNADVQEALDLVFDYRGFGLDDEVRTILESLQISHPIVSLLLGRRASDCPKLEGLFPNRPEEIALLMSADQDDWMAQALLGHVLYDRARHLEAIEAWERSVAVNHNQSVVWRNLGIGYFNILGDAERAKKAYDIAISVSPGEARLVYESDQLAKRVGIRPEVRLKRLEELMSLTLQRDDLTLEFVALLNQTSQPEKAAEVLGSREFSPWEGGEGTALALHVRTYILLSRKQEVAGKRVAMLEQALTVPSNLGEDRHLLANGSELWLEMGDALAAAGQLEQSKEWYQRAANFRGDFEDMAVRTYSGMTYFRALALMRLERHAEAVDLLRGLEQYAIELEKQPARVDYFATSLPTMLLFKDDLQKRQQVYAKFMRAQASLGLGKQEFAKTLLAEVLEQDPSYAAAQDLLEVV